MQVAAKCSRSPGRGPEGEDRLRTGIYLLLPCVFVQLVLGKTEASCFCLRVWYTGAVWSTCQEAGSAAWPPGSASQGQADWSGKQALHMLNDMPCELAVL